MKKILIVFYSVCTVLLGGTLNAKNPVKVHDYRMEIAINNPVIDIVADITMSASSKKSFLLFNECVQIKRILLNNQEFKYTFINDTMFFELHRSNATLHVEYSIPECITFQSIQEDSIVHGQHCNRFLPASQNHFQVLFERYYRWYPLLYNNWANYQVKVVVDDTCQAFGYIPEDSISVTTGKSYYYYNLYDEDFPFFVTSSIPYRKTIIQADSVTTFNFYFLLSPKRFLKRVEESYPFAFTEDPHQKDSLLDVVMQRCVKAFQWYSQVLWKQDIVHINIIETSMGDVGFGLNSMIVVNPDMINWDILHQSSLPHEIGHLWVGQHTEYESKGKYFLGESVNEYIDCLFYEFLTNEEALDRKILDYKYFSDYKNPPQISVSFDEILQSRKHVSDITNDILYSKGPVFLHEFRRMIGKEKFLQIVKDTYSKAYKFVNLKDFERSIKRNKCYKAYKMLFQIEKM
jgi:hypothetical protein